MCVHGSSTPIYICACVHLCRPRIGNGGHACANADHALHVAARRGCVGARPPYTGHPLHTGNVRAAVPDGHCILGNLSRRRPSRCRLETAQIALKVGAMAEYARERVRPEFRGGAMSRREARLGGCAPGGPSCHVTHSFSLRSRRASEGACGMSM
ncbi:hypothetical protein C2E23DRAFT_500629 [Lenzites betulinus]|nr:hypothetical protein C2E23DRAFT_500629 [Lenzites betulinus]